METQECMVGYMTNPQIVSELQSSYSVVHQGGQMDRHMFILCYIIIYYIEEV